MPKLIRIAGRSKAIEAANRILGLTPTCDELANLQELFDHERREDLFAATVRGERAVYDFMFRGLESGRLHLFDVLDIDGQRPKETLDDFNAWRYKPHVPSNHALFLQLRNRALEVSRLAWHERQRAIETILVAVGRSQADLNRLFPVCERETLLVQLFFPPLTRMQEAALRDQAKIRCAMVGIACERFRLRHGHWPPVLVELDRDLLSVLPKDPYDREPLRIKQTDDGIIVYSIGPNRIDDGGNLKDHAVGADNHDLGFRLWNVDMRRLPAVRNAAPDIPPKDFPNG